jgi:hypothetical protein
MRNEGTVYAVNVDSLGEILTTSSLEHALLARSGWERKGHVVSIFVVETSRLGRS